MKTRVRGESCREKGATPTLIRRVVHAFSRRASSARPSRRYIILQGEGTSRGVCEGRTPAEAPEGCGTSKSAAGSVAVNADRVLTGVGRGSRRGRGWAKGCEPISDRAAGCAAVGGGECSSKSNRWRSARLVEAVVHSGLWGTSGGGLPVTRASLNMTEIRPN